MSKETINVDELKQKFGTIKEITCGKLTAYFRKPDLKIWRFALKAIEKSQTEFKKALAVNCFVAGDKELIASPYIEDISDVIDEFVNYEDAEVDHVGNAYVVKVMDKSARFKTITIEMQTQAERNNPDDIAFKTQQNLLEPMWLDGDQELRDSKNLDYYMPVLRALKDLREKHILTIKNA